MGIPTLERRHIYFEFHLKIYWRHLSPQSIVEEKPVMAKFSEYNFSAIHV